ncbi:MAG: hypothetical protein AAF705_15530, partial [Bacteroidota bacterium]
MNAPQMKTKSFWKRPEGITGLIFLAAITAGVGFLAVSLPWGEIFASTIYLAATFAVLGTII